jgi:hypothetical protein
VTWTIGSKPSTNSKPRRRWNRARGHDGLNDLPEEGNIADRQPWIGLYPQNSCYGGLK